MKPFIFISLFTLYTGYSLLVYTKGTENHSVDKNSVSIRQGKLIFQQYNCISCHQIYGLGGYLGPDLTNAWSDPQRGPAYMNALLVSGGSRMPDFHLNKNEVKALMDYFRYVDSSSRFQSLNP